MADQWLLNTMADPRLIPHLQRAAVQKPGTNSGKAAGLSAKISLGTCHGKEIIPENPKACPLFVSLCNFKLSLGTV